MKLLVIVLCLLSERYLIHVVSYRRFDWFNGYFLWLKQFTDKHVLWFNPWCLFVIVILPIILSAAVLYGLLCGVLWGLLGFIISMMIFLYCLGPQNVFYPVSHSKTQATEVALGHYFTQVNSQLFAVIFWYVVAGPVAVVAYRVIHLCTTISAISQQAGVVNDWLEWIPARMSALLYLLVGNFQQGFIPFSRLFFTKPQCNHQILRECGLRSLQADGGGGDGLSLTQAECLVEHATVVLMVLIALCTLASSY